MTDLHFAQTIIFGLVLVNALACLFLIGLQSFSAAQPALGTHHSLRAQRTKLGRLANSDPLQACNDNDKSEPLWFSIHVPVHNEPPHLVIATLRYLAEVDFDCFEVIVIDNNTKDPAVWRPVEAACAKLGPRFRFYHFDEVVGAKAGALNIAARLAAPEATHFAIVDADYQVTPEFLRASAEAIASTGADFIQFPQAYRDHTAAHSVVTELADYFLTVASGTNRQKAMLLTGTLSVIARHAFDAVGGWSGRTITEDAELGVRLYQGEHRGAYIHKVVGRGLLPLNFLDLAKQRDRWVAGNCQTLIAAIRSGLLPTNKAAAAIWSQLTAWVCLCAIPAFALVVLALLPDDHWISNTTAFVAGLTILVSLLANPIRWPHQTLDGGCLNQGAEKASGKPAPLQHRETDLMTWLGVRRVKLALLWTSSLAWIPLLFGARPGFARTPKAGQRNAGQKNPAVFMPKLAILSAVFAIAASLHFAEGDLVAGVSSAILAMSWFAARHVDDELTGRSTLGRRHRLKQEGGPR